MGTPPRVSASDQAHDPLAAELTHTTRALWRKEPAQQVQKMVAVAEKMYNCDMPLAAQADPSTIVSIYLDMEDGILKMPLLRSASAWGSLSAISTESERRSGQSGTAVLLSDSSVSEAEVPLRRIAQVLYLIEVALECLVVCAANSTSGSLVTHAKYPSAGNHGIVNKGEANGEPPSHATHCTVHRPMPPLTPHECAAEKHLQFTQSTRMAIMRQYVSLSGSHGVQRSGNAFPERILASMEEFVRRRRPQFGQCRPRHTAPRTVDEAVGRPQLRAAYGGPGRAVSGQRTGA